MRRIIERPRLLKLLEESDAQTILLVAPAGYGKTTLARQWAAQKATWGLSARDGSSDVAQLALQLANALSPYSSSILERVTGVIQGLSNPGKQQHALIETFAAVVSQRELSGVVGVIDDYHHIAYSDAADRFFGAIRQRLRMRLFIASRTAPIWATARENLYGEALELGPRELALTDEESSELLARLSHAERKLIIGRARGWPALIGLAALTGQSGAPREVESSTLFRFFAEELFQAFDESLKSSLTTLALLPELDPDLLSRTLGSSYPAVVTRAETAGFLTVAPSGPELHPLIRDYLLTKLEADHEATERIAAAFDLALKSRRWDGGFQLLRRFPRSDLLDALLTHALKPLALSGRVATLASIATFADEAALPRTSLLDLVDAEVALRDAEFSKAGALAQRVARRLDVTHPLRSHAHWIVGHAAQLTFEYRTASESFRAALACAQDDDDQREALWGLVLTSLYGEASDADDVIQKYGARRDKSDLDYVRYVNASSVAKRYGQGFRDVEGTEEALFVLPRVADPRVRTSFLNTLAYHSILVADYTGALELAGLNENEVDSFQLTWVAAHVHWTKAAAALGLRNFAESVRELQKVDHFANALADGYLLLNGAALRARLLLALRRPDDALAVVSLSHDAPMSPSMRAEYVATRALVYAVAGDAGQARALAHEAREATSSIEAVSLAHWVSVLIGDESTSESLGYAIDKGVWDPTIAALRASPDLLKHTVSENTALGELTMALTRSEDYDLARANRIRLPPRPSRNAKRRLSPREEEVLGLIRQGLTNRDISKALFVSEATVKVHVRHILEKSGARSRAEAAAWDPDSD